MDRGAINGERAAIQQQLQSGAMSEQEAYRRMQRLRQAQQHLGAPEPGPTGQVEINIYDGRQLLEDLKKKYADIENPTEQQKRDFGEIIQRLETDVAFIQQDFEGKQRDGAGKVLVQARLQREQVEREITAALERGDKLKPGDVERLNTWTRWLGRLGRDVAGGAGGAIVGGGIANAAGLTIAAGGTLASSAVILPTAGALALIYGGAVAGTALTRYLPRMLSRIPYLGRAIPGGEGARAEAAFVRRKAIMQNESKVEQFADALRTDALSHRARMSQMVRDEVKSWAYRGKEAGVVARRAAGGALLGAAVAGGAVYFDSSSATGAEVPITDVSYADRYAEAMNSTLARMEAWTKMTPLVGSAFTGVQEWVPWLWATAKAKVGSWFPAGVKP